MKGFLGFALFIGIMIGVISIIAGFISDIDLTIRYYLIAFGVLVLIGVGKGIKSLKDFKWG
ncbi:MAG: hypothetical protein JSV09_11725 [Thermoplasmata archaeon]|nr:MAG: hypothetical protein JSV09_11725 [Thermoplasmata archaeon]